MVRFAPLLMLFTCAEPVRPQVHAGPLRADITLTNVNVRQYRGGTLKVHVASPHLELMRGSSDFSAADASVSLLRSGVQILTTSVAGNATAQVATGSGGVRFIGNDGAVGHAPSATYDRAIGTGGGAHGDAGVWIEHPRFRLDALGFEADFASEAVAFDQPRTATNAGQ